MGTTDKGKAVFVMNAGKTESDITDDSTSFSYTNHASKTTEAYLSTSVNPLFVQNNLQYENSVASSSLDDSANFIEIRNTSHGGSISNDISDKIGNRIYPTNNTLTSFATNRDETHSYKVKVFDSQFANSETNRKFVYSTSNYPATEEVGIDIENFDYFILINPDTLAMGTDAIRPHFAKVTRIISFDEFGDGLEFEPAYPTELDFGVKFEVYKGPAKTSTDIVAVTYGLRGDTLTSTPKHDEVNVCSRPTWYFYNDRLDEKDQLDYMTKYTATHLRWWNYSTNIAMASVTTHAPFTVGTSSIKFVTSGSSNTEKLSVGMSIFNSSDVYLGNIESISSNDVLLDFARVQIDSASSFNVKVGKTIQNVIFRTEAKFNNTIHSLGKSRLEAVLVDANKVSDDSNSSDFYRWQNAFPKMHRHTANSDTTTPTTLDGNLTGPGKYITFEKANFKNNKIPLITHSQLNQPRNKMSQLAEFKVLDSSGLQHLKIKEEDDLILERNIFNGGAILLPVVGKAARDSSNTSKITLSDINKKTDLRAILGNGVGNSKAITGVLVNTPGTLSAGSTATIPVDTVDATGHFQIGDIVYGNSSKIGTISSLTATQIVLESNVLINVTNNMNLQKESTGPNCNTIVEIDGYHYVVDRVHTQLNGTQSFIIKDSKAKTANTFSGSAVAQNFSNKDMQVAQYTGVLNTTLTPDTEFDLDSSRLSLSEITVDKEKAKLYNSRWVNGVFNKHNNRIDYGDKDNKYLKMQDADRVFYQRANENRSRFYYYKGGYAISDNAFTGIVEDITSKSEQGMTTYSVVGRDETSKLLSETVSKNTVFLEDILHSSIPPIVNSTAITNTGDSSPYANLTITGATVNWAGTLSPAPKRHGLLLNQAGELIGEVKTATSTSVTLYDDNYSTPTSTTSLRYYHPFDSAYVNPITGTKALSSNEELNTGISGFTSISEKAIGFNDGLALSGTYEANSATFTFSQLSATSNTGSYATDRTLGYDISSPRAISTNDSIFAFTAGNENGATLDKIDIASVSKEAFDVVQVNEKDESQTTLTVAPIFPVVLGRLDSNTSDTRGNANLYLINNTMDTGGFIHRLQDSNTSYYGPKESMRYWDLQKFGAGTITKTHSSIYREGTRNQRIQGYAVAYGVKADGTVFTPSVTNDSKPLAGSNTIDGWTYASNFFGSNDDIPLIRSYSAIRNQADFQPHRRGYAPSGLENDIQYASFEQIDPRAETYELLAVGDLFPASKLRPNSLGYHTKEYSDYGIILEGKSSTSSKVSHEKYTGQTKQTLQSENMFEDASITSATQTTNQFRRFGVMRLVEATFDWHFNPVDYESLPNAEDIPTVQYFDYIQADLPPTAETASNAIVLDSDGVHDSDTVSETTGDVFYQTIMSANFSTRDSDGTTFSATIPANSTNSITVSNGLDSSQGGKFTKVGDVLYNDSYQKLGTIASINRTTRVITFEANIPVDITNSTLKVQQGVRPAGIMPGFPFESGYANLSLAGGINGFVAAFSPSSIYTAEGGRFTANLIFDSEGGGSISRLHRYEGGNDYYGVQPFRLFSTTDFNIDNLSASNGRLEVKVDRDQRSNEIRFSHVWICSPSVVSTNFKWTKRLVDSSNTTHTFDGHDIILPLISEEYKGTWSDAGGTGDFGIFTREPDMKDRRISAFNYFASSHRHISRVLAGLHHRDLSNTDISDLKFRYSVGQSAGNSTSFAHIYEGCIGIFRGFKQGADVHREGFGSDIIGNNDIVLSTKLSIGTDSDYSNFVTSNTNDFEQVSRNTMIQRYRDSFTTVATAYSDGDTSLVLEDASSFESSGNGFINGVAFSWTNKSSNTLTVPDLNADYAAGTIVEENQTSLAMTGTKATDSILSKNPELGVGNQARKFSSENTFQSTVLDNRQSSGGVFSAQMLVKPTFNITHGSNGVSVSSKTIQFTLNSDTEHAWLSYVPDLTGYYLATEKASYTVRAKDNSGNETTTDATLRNNTTVKILPTTITRITNHTISTAPSTSAVEVHTITVDTAITGRCRLMRPSEVAFDNVQGEIQFNTFLSDNKGRDWRTGEGRRTDDPTYSESVYHMYLPLSIDNVGGSRVEKRTGSTAIGLFSDLEDGDVLDMHITDGEIKSRKKITVKKTIEINENRTQTGLTLQFDGKLNGSGVVSFGETFDITLGRKPKLKDIQKCHVGTSYTIASQLEKEVENIVKKAGLEYNAARSFSNPTGNIVSAGTTMLSTGVIVNGAHNSAASTITVDGIDATTIFAEGDSVFDDSGVFLGFVSSTTATAINLTAGHLVGISDNENLQREGVTCSSSVTGISVGDVLYSYDGHLIGEVALAGVSGSTIAFRNRYFSPQEHDEIVKINKKTFVTNLKFDNSNLYSALNSLIIKRGLDYNIKNGEFVTRNIEDVGSLRKYALSYAESNRLVSVKSNKSMFDKANKIVVVGDKVKFELQKPTKKQTRTIKVVDPTIKTRTDAETKAIELMDIHEGDARKISIELQKEGLELLEAGDILRLNFPNHNIPIDDYIVYEIENVLAGTLKINVGTFDKTIAERLSEISTQQSQDSTTLLGRDSVVETAGKFLFDAIKLKNISLSYTITGPSNALSRNSNMGFDDLFGFTEEVGFEHSTVTKKTYRDRFYEQENY